MIKYKIFNILNDCIKYIFTGFKRGRYYLLENIHIMFCVLVGIITWIAYIVGVVKNIPFYFKDFKLIPKIYSTVDDMKNVYFQKSIIDFFLILLIVYVVICAIQLYLQRYMLRFVIMIIANIGFIIQNISFIRIEEYYNLDTIAVFSLLLFECLLNFCICIGNTNKNFWVIVFIGIPIFIIPIFIIIIAMLLISVVISIMSVLFSSSYEEKILVDPETGEKTRVIMDHSIDD